MNREALKYMRGELKWWKVPIILAGHILLGWYLLEVAPLIGSSGETDIFILSLWGAVNVLAAIAFVLVTLFWPLMLFHLINVYLYYKHCYGGKSENDACR